MKVSRVVFLDRDGTIARDVSYCSRPEDLELLPGVPQGIKLLNEHGFRVIVVTNQSGIARGYFTEDTLGRIHHKMRTDLARYGAFIDAIYYCPHHPEAGCLCRKPNTGLFEQAAKDWALDMSRAYIAGDREMDIIAAKRLRCKAVLILGEQTERDFWAKGATPQAKPDFVSVDFLSAARWVLTDAGISRGVSR